MVLYKATLITFPEGDPPELVFPEEGWLRANGGGILCSICHHINRVKYPAPLDVMLDSPPEDGLPCAPVETTGITVWRRSFLGRLTPFLTNFVIGNCQLKDGQVIEDYVTCYSRKSVVLQGGPKSRYQICPQCKTVTSAVAPGPQYILAASLNDSAVYQDGAGNLYLTDRAAKAFDYQTWEVEEFCYSHAISFETVAVRDEPADGQILSCIS